MSDGKTCCSTLSMVVSCLEMRTVTCVCVTLLLTRHNMNIFTIEPVKSRRLLILVSIFLILSYFMLIFLDESHISFTQSLFVIYVTHVLVGLLAAISIGSLIVNYAGSKQSLFLLVLSSLLAAVLCVILPVVGLLFAFAAFPPI